MGWQLVSCEARSACTGIHSSGTAQALTVPPPYRCCRDLQPLVPLSGLFNLVGRMGIGAQMSTDT